MNRSGHHRSQQLIVEAYYAKNREIETLYGHYKLLLIFTLVYKTKKSEWGGSQAQLVA